MKFQITFIILIITLFSCSQTKNEKPKIEISSVDLKVAVTDSTLQKHFEKEYHDKKSISKGSVSDGTLENGAILPYEGKNFKYFDTISYLANRGFLNSMVKQIVLNTYKEMETVFPNEHFCIMECSYKHGGEIKPHHTHQNGLSVDFMVPKIKNGARYYGLDGLGAEHYWLQFNENGQWIRDTSVSIDFEKVAKHILLLDKNARKLGCKVNKIILMKELKDELYNTKSGKLIKKQNIYITKNLSRLNNNLHDEHYHIDFEILEKI